MDAKKTYTITPEGIRFLEEQKSQLADVRERMSGWWDRRSEKDEAHEVLDMSKEVRRLLKHRRRAISPAQWEQIRAVLNRAYREIETLLND